LKKNEKINDAANLNEIISLRETAMYDILKLFLKENWLKNIDDESYLFDVLETAKMFKEFLNESYLVPTKVDKNLIFGIVTINLAKKLKEFVNKNNCLVLMSGTLHSPEVLKNIFGLEDFKIVEAEIKDQGEIEIVRTGLEKDCKYSNFFNGEISREEYLKSLEKCVRIAKRPTLIHVNAFSDIPTQEEIEKFNLKNLISRRELKEKQSKDSTGEAIKKFKKGKIDILFSTRDSRGVDFPGEQCNSIIFTKYPNPNVQDAFWKILMKTNPSSYWAFYKDKARREFLQKIYRGLRFKTDHVCLLSPDSRVLDMAEKELKN
jgi:Rad3-related DNA helicase